MTRSRTASSAAALALAVGLAFAVCPDEARAERNASVTLHGSLFSGFPDFLGASVFVRVPVVPLELEGGFWATPMFAAGYYARAGHAFELLDRRSARRGWRLDLPVMIGFQTATVGCCGNNDDFTGADATVSLDATYWLLSHLGLSAKVTLGAMLGSSRTVSSAGQPVVDAPTTREVLPIARLAVGLAF